MERCRDRQGPWSCVNLKVETYPNQTGRPPRCGVGAVDFGVDGLAKDFLLFQGYNRTKFCLQGMTKHCTNRKFVEEQVFPTGNTPLLDDYAGATEGHAWQKKKEERKIQAWEFASHVTDLVSVWRVSLLNGRRPTTSLPLPPPSEGLSKLQHASGHQNHG